MQVDSRRVEEGDLFVAVGGGEDFVPHALARGASAALVPDNAVAALAAIAGAVRDRSQARVVGITGSTGKTSTKDILFALCAPHRRTIANEGNYNTEIGVPLTICRIEADTEICICELAMRGPGQIAWLASFVRPDIGVITNIGPAHLEFLGTLEAIAQAKAELIAGLPAGGIAVVPAGASARAVPRAQRYRGEARRPRRAAAVRHELLGGASARQHPHGCGRGRVPRHSACPDELLTVEFSKRREEERELPGGGLLLNDCYNANPVSMRAALEHLVARADGRRRIAVLGEMRELGPTAPSYHAEIGELVRTLGIEQVIAVGELARAYGGDWVATAEEAAAALRRVLEPGDIVLVKGSLAVGLEVVAENLTA